MTGEVKTTAARQAQSKADKQSVRDKLLNKKPRTKEINVTVDGESVTLKFQAISATALDKLRAKHKPTAKQLADGMGVNLDTFNPELVSMTLIDPDLDLSDVKAIFNADNWSTGELNQIFNAASDVCMEGMNVPSNASV